MDETQSSRVSDAAATRKRRSSILKSQRAPRTPFSELEFNVATPNDTGKSRRVSFSRRMGVAEFVTNEATTTWKNFYEEHNKSLESSGNESAANAARPSISHIGKRIFDQQFEEVEAVDFGSALLPANTRAPDFSISINNINLTQHLVEFDRSVDDKKLNPPQQHLELSSLTEHKSKIFSDDLTIPNMGEMSNQINVNFSVMNPIENIRDKCDDLDEIQKDLERSHNVMCPGPFREEHMSGYIEVDLNMTHVAIRIDESDMSITDTIHSPKVQEVSTNKSVNKSTKSLGDLDWTTDKENIAVLNPYVAPKESDNFAINEIPDHVLVFDGKKLIVQTETNEIPVQTKELKNADEGIYRQTLLPDAPLEIKPQRKAVVLNINDDLPNFIEKPILSHLEDPVTARDVKHATIFNEVELSMTDALPNVVQSSDMVNLSSKDKVIECDNMTIGNISITRAVSSNVIIQHDIPSEKRKTILNDDGNISMTQAIPANILFDNKTEIPNKRRATVYDDGNMSFTQAIPANLIVSESEGNTSNKTILFPNNIDDISFTQGLPNNICLEKLQNNQTTVFEKSVGNISMTQVLPSNIIMFDNEPISDKRKTIIYGCDDGNVTMTQAIPNKIITGKTQDDVETINKRKTIVFENETGNVSLTQVLPAKIIQQEVLNKSALVIEPHKIIVNNPIKDQENKMNVTASESSINTSKHMSVSRKRLTVMYDEHAEISMTETLPINNLSTNPQQQADQINVVYENVTGLSGTLTSNISYKGHSNENIALQLMDKTHDIMSMTQVVSNSSNLELMDNDKSKIGNKSYSNVKYHISTVTLQDQELKKTTEVIETGNVAMTKPIPNEISEIGNKTLKLNEEKFSNLSQFSEQTLLQDTTDNNKTNVEVLVYQSKTYDNVEMQKINETDHGDLAREPTRTSFNIEKTDSISNESVKPTCNNSDIVDEKDIELQVDLLNGEMPQKTDSVSGYVGVIETINSKISQGAKENKSILHELLDMSSCSMDDHVVDKKVMVKFDSELVHEKSQKGSESNSNEIMFVVTQDCIENVRENENMAKDSFVNISNAENLAEIDKSELPALKFNTDQENNFEEKHVESRSVINEEKKARPHNRYFEKIVSPDLLKTKQEDKSQVEDIKIRKSFKEADDTKELLEILSDFTDRKSYPPIKEECNKDESKIKLRSSMALEHKTEVPDPRRLSFAPKRQSIVLSREDLLNNLSMAQAVLQQTHFEDSDMEDTATESSPEINESFDAPKKSVRMSNEVVKTLHFEDESCSDASLKSELKMSPLKKTAFGETTYMKESKVNVIPTYLKDVSDNIKALMNDLVKPRPDQMPFEVATPRAKKQTSTCSTEIQANLVTSSQIDLDVDLQSNVNSVYELNKSAALVTDIADTGNNAISSALKTHVDTVSNVSGMDDGNEPNALQYHKVRSTLKHPQEPILVFDHHNPLNNVLLAPPNYIDVHRYDPIKSSEKLRVEGDTDEPKKGNHCEEERVITQYNVESHIGLQSGDASSDKKGESHMLCSDPSKPLSMDRSTEGFATEVKNTEVNTVIVMKGNKELLEASSSLTLVDDALMQSVFDVKVESRKVDENSPVKVIYKIDDEDVSMLENNDSDLVSNADEPLEYTKAKKRSYSPTRRDATRPTTVSSPDVTPKPISKMKKISNSPNVYNTHPNISHASTLRSEKTDSDCDKTESNKKRSPRKSKASPKHLKPGTDLTVQRLMTEYKITKMEQDLIEDQIIEAIHERMSSCGTDIDEPKTTPHSPEVVSSCTSSKDQNEREDVCVKETVSYVGSQPSQVDWKPDLKELSSRNILMECESSVNVVAKIDMLPFMGRSRECEWEASAGDTWVFRLLRARLRLRVRLAHRVHNAPRSRVRADTPVEELAVDAVPVEERDPLAALCVRFACEAMRYECARGCARAGDVPPALRRCAGVARVALRWARAMRDARARLAYTLRPDGLLTLKVANVSLRSVWEVSVRLELVVGDAREAAWPRAGEPRVRSVLGDRAPPAPPAPAALAAVPRDWGHAPRTIWKVFRYLKNLTRNDDFLEVPGEQLQEAR